MRTMTRTFLSGAVAICVLAAAATTASANSVLSTTGPASPLPSGTQLQLLASATTQLASAPGNINCSGPYSMVGSVTVTNPLLTPESQTIGKLTSLFLGNNLSRTTTTPGHCSTTMGLAYCDYASVLPTGGLAIEGQDSPGSNPRVASLRLGSTALPLALSMTCRSSDGSYLPTCTFRSATSTQPPFKPYAPLNTTAGFTGSPSKASAFGFRQALYGEEGGTGKNCRFPFSSGTFSGSFSLYTKPTSGTPQQVYLWDKP